MKHIELSEEGIRRRLGSRPITTGIVAFIMVLIVAATLLTDRWAQSSLADWRTGWQGPDYEVLLEPGLDSLAVEVVRGRIEVSGPVTRTNIVGAESARTELEEILGPGIFDALQENPLSSAIQVDVVPSMRSDSLVARLAEETLFFPGVVDVIYDPERLQVYRAGDLTRMQFADKTRPYGITLCLVLMAAFWLALLRFPRRRFEALIWWGYSDRPFVRGAMAEGALGGLLTVGIGYGISELIARRVIPLVPAQSTVGPSWQFILGFIGIAIVLGAVCGYLAAGGYRRVR